MGRRGKKKKTPPPQPPSPPPPVSSMAAAKEEENDLGKKLVYTSIYRTRESVNSWIMIDPNYRENENQDDDCRIIRFKLVPEMEFPGHLDLHEIHYYGCAVCDSKVYFIGGLAGSMAYPDYYSKKVFIYDLASKKWEEEEPCNQLNVARAFPSVVVIEKVIYVFGGRTDRGNIKFTKEQWIECYNPKKRKWEFLPSSSSSSAPPPAVFKAEGLNFHIVYGSQILFFFPITGVYSFNYVTKTWKDCPPSMNQCAKIACDQVAVVDDVLFRHYFGTIYAYDLSNNRMLFSHSLRGFVKMSFGGGDPEIFMPGFSFLVRVAKETLLLICWDDLSRNNNTRLHCYRFHIQKSSSSQQDSGFDYHLREDGCIFSYPWL